MMKRGLSCRSTTSNLKKQLRRGAIANVLAILDENEQKEMQAINRALARIELGEFGACEVCGKEIEVERLEAIPWTSVCSKHARTE